MIKYFKMINFFFSELLFVPLILDKRIDNFLSSVSEDWVKFVGKSLSELEGEFVVGGSLLLGFIEDLGDGVVDGVWVVLREVSKFEWVFVDVSDVFVSAVDDSHSVNEEIWAVDLSLLLDGNIVGDWVLELVVGGSADILGLDDGDGLIIEDGSDGVGGEDIALSSEHLEVSLEVDVVDFDLLSGELLLGGFDVILVDIPGNNLLDLRLDEVVNDELGDVTNSLAGNNLVLEALSVELEG